MNKHTITTDYSRVVDDYLLGFDPEPATVIVEEAVALDWYHDCELDDVSLIATGKE